MRRRALVTAMVLLGSVSAAPADQGLPPKLREIGIDQRLGESVPLDLPLRDESGRTVHLGDYFGRRPVVLSLVYFDCPMLCSLSSKGLVSALSTLSFDAGREFEVVTVSFDPRETPEQAAAKKSLYLNRYARPGAEKGWHFLTGEQASIERLTSAVGFRYSYDEETKQYVHAGGVVVLTGEGRIARYLYGIEYAPRDLRLALVEASENRIGSAVDQFLLFCYQYDPHTGRYSALTMRIVRTGGVLTVAALGAFILLMWRRERSHAHALAGRVL